MIKEKSQQLRFVCFVSSHGFGHATRVSAIIQQISKKFTSLEIIIFGETPLWFWQLNIPSNCSFSLHEQVTDVGLVQLDPFTHNLNLTLDKVDKFISTLNYPNDGLLAKVANFKPNFILCDISVLGIKVGGILGVPSILVENFTWDWIYEPFKSKEKYFGRVIPVFKEIYKQANKRIQCIPICQEIDGTTKINPIYRDLNGNKESTFSKLSLGQENKYILVTTGGISMKHAFNKVPKPYFLVVPGDYSKIIIKDGVIYLPMNSDIPFPDLVNSASCVIGKAGYGTIAECWGMNIPFYGVFRKSFRESNVLRNFCRNNLISEEISLAYFISGGWLKSIPDLIDKAKKKDSENKHNGATQACEEIISYIFP